MKSPALQWYPKQYLGDDKVLAMDWDARGMHHWLLNISWQQEPKGSIPNDMALIRRWLGSPSDDIWRRVRPQIFSAWSFRDGRWFNGGMVRAAVRQQAFSESRTKSVRKRYEKPTSAQKTEEVLVVGSTSLKTENNQNQEITTTPPTPSKLKRKTRDEVIAGFSEAVAAVVNPLLAEWPAKQPQNKHPIRIDVAQFADRVDNILKNHSALSPPLLVEAARDYLKQEKNFYHAPQYFFGPGNGTEPPWRSYARMVWHMKQQQEKAPDERIQRATA
jgi:hypothetical protein